MQCGAKCFIIEIAEKGKSRQERVIARTPAKARKVIRNKLGEEVDIVSVIEEKK